MFPASASGRGEGVSLFQHLVKARFWRVSEVGSPSDQCRNIGLQCCGQPLDDQHGRIAGCPRSRVFAPTRPASGEQSGGELPPSDPMTRAAAVAVQIRGLSPEILHHPRSDLKRLQHPASSEMWKPPWRPRVPDFGRAGRLSTRCSEPHKPLHEPRVRTSVGSSVAKAGACGGRRSRQSAAAIAVTIDES